MQTFQRENEIIDFKRVYKTDKIVKIVFEYNTKNGRAEDVINQINPYYNYGRTHFLNVLNQILNIELPFCYLQFCYSSGTAYPHIMCMELCDESGNKIKVDIEKSAIIRKFAKMYGIQTYCFKSTEETKAINFQVMNKYIYNKQLLKEYTFIRLPEKVVFKKIEETTEYLIVDFLKFPNSKNNCLSTEYAGAVCIKIDSDVI